MLKIHSSRVKSRIIDLSMEAFDYGHNNSFDLTVISCCYIALREENIPISLKEVAVSQ